MPLISVYGWRIPESTVRFNIIRLDRDSWSNILSIVDPSRINCNLSWIRAMSDGGGSVGADAMKG